MNERQPPEHEMLDDVAVLALGAMPPEQARVVREHMTTCAICREEYAGLSAVASAVGLSAQTAGDLANCPSTLLKPKIMQQVRADAARSAAPPHSGPVARIATARPAFHWPAYLAAAACLAIAIGTSMWAASVGGKLQATQVELARSNARSDALAQTLARQRTTLSDLLDARGKHYVVGASEVVTRGSRAYIAMHGLSAPPQGHVYQAWTLPKGSKTMVPSLTFLPDAHGVAVVALPPDARATAVVAVSVEPAGGSKQPTTKPILVVPLT